MSDLAERLFGKSTDCHASDEALYREAAARIEQLEAALRGIKRTAAMHAHPAVAECYRIARAALAPET